MRLTPLAIFALLAALASGEARDESLVLDTESVRQVVHSLLNGGELVSEETLDGLADGYSGTVRDYLDELKRQFSEAKAASEIYVRDQKSDLEIVAKLLANLEKLGGLTSSLGDAILTITKGPSRALLEPFLNSKIRKGRLTLSYEMTNKVNDVVSALERFLSSSTEQLTEELLKFAQTLPAGHVKTFFIDLHRTITQIEEEEQEVETPIDEDQVKLSPVKVETDKGAFDQILNKQNVKYVVDLLHDKQQAIAKIDMLLTRDYESEDLPKILKAIRECLN